MTEANKTESVFRISKQREYVSLPQPSGHKLLQESSLMVYRLKACPELRFRGGLLRWIPGHDCMDAVGRATHDYRGTGGRVRPERFQGCKRLKSHGTGFPALTEDAKAEARHEELLAYVF